MNKKENFRFILRFTMQPEHNEKEIMEKLIRYCESGRIEEVMFFINCEDLFQGHLTKAEYKPWVDMIINHMPLIKEKGIDISLNPWSTLSHADRGRKMNPLYNFQTMVDKNGLQSSITGCPSDESFVDYLCDIYSYFSQIAPKVIWVEDDFRLHNHAPLEWGGCFCPIHMEKYSQRLGRKVEREEFVSGLLTSGAPNEYRKVWLDVSKDTMVNFAGKIGQAVRSVSANTIVGLMSSGPSTHCIEGRDWKGIFEGFASGKIAHSRPHLPAYSEPNTLQYLYNFSNISLKTVMLLPKETEVYPELDNGPWTSYSKSDKFAGYQIELSAVAGAKGITMNLFEMNGNGIDPNENFDEKLSDIKAYMNEVTALDLKPGKIEGVINLYSDKSSYTVHTPQKGGIEKLAPYEDLWAGMLPCFGISSTVSTDIEHKGKVLGISGQFFRNLANDEIIKLFEDNFLLLDGEASVTLFDMGLGYLAGIKSCRVIPQDSGINSYEEICNNKEYAGIKKARATCQILTGDYVQIGYEKDVKVISNIMSYDRSVSGVGMATYKNCFIFPYIYVRNHFPQALFTNVRRAVIADVLKGTGIGIGMTKGYPGMAVYCYENAFVVANSSLDDVENTEIYVPKAFNKEIYEIGRDGIKRATCEMKEDGIIKLEGTTRHLTTRTFVW